MRLDMANKLNGTTTFGKEMAGYKNRNLEDDTSGTIKSLKSGIMQ